MARSDHPLLRRARQRPRTDGAAGPHRTDARRPGRGRNYWSPATTAAWQPLGVALLAPYRSAKRDPHPRWSTLLSRVRYRIDTVVGQLVDRCNVKRVWARDLWHLCNRLLRTVLMHTLAVLLNVDLGNPPLHLAQLVA